MAAETKMEEISPNQEQDELDILHRAGEAMVARGGRVPNTPPIEYNLQQSGPTNDHLHTTHRHQKHADSRLQRSSSSHGLNLGFLRGNEFNHAIDCAGSCARKDGRGVQTAWYVTQAGSFSRLA